MVEAGAAAEVVTLGERDPQAARGRVIGRGQTMDPAADDEQVELLRTEPIKIAGHSSFLGSRVRQVRRVRVRQRTFASAYSNPS
jgi:hypothetical protein